MEPVELHVHEHVATIHFGDPARKNVLDPALLQALAERLLEAAATEAARLVVLEGRGGTWSAGYDIASIPAALFSEDPAEIAAHPFESCMRVLRELALPTLAVLRGEVFGGGLELALSCDLRLAASGTRFGITPARLGLVYSHTGIRKLVDLVGPAHARMLLFSGRAVHAEQAAQMGLVNEVHPDTQLENHATDLARHIAACAPLAVQGMKQVLGILERHALAPAEEATILALRRRAYESRDFREGQAAFAAKRSPHFEGR